MVESVPVVTDLESAIIRQVEVSIVGPLFTP